MKKQAKDLKKGDIISIAGKKCIVNAVEISDIGKQGKRKVRLELKTETGDNLIVIRPEDYPVDTV